MKITIYELLGMIKDDKAPKKIKYNTFELKRTMSNNLLRMYVDEDGMFFPEYYSGLTLNDEVEILEEKGIPKKIDIIGWDKCIYGVTTKEKELAIEIKKTQKLLNQVLDYLKSKGDE